MTERALINRINDSVAEEADCEQNNNCIAAANAGLKTWSSLKELMKILDAKNICDLEYRTMFDLLYWASSLAHNLHNAAIRDKSFFQKKFLFCKEYVEMHEDFLNKNMRNLGNVRRTYAECYVDLGDFESFDRLYEQWLANEPDWGWGWIGWSDRYWLFRSKNKNLTKAINILEKALAIKSVTDKNHIIDRLNELKMSADATTPCQSL